jgi:hypothetical protein
MLMRTALSPALIIFSMISGVLEDGPRVAKVFALPILIVVSGQWSVVSKRVKLTTDH